MPFETTSSQYRSRIENPDHFKEGTLRSKELPGIKGITLIVGKLKDSFVAQGKDAKAMVTQAIRFSRKYWSNKEAKQWIESHATKLNDSQNLYDAHRLGVCADCAEFGALLDAKEKQASFSRNSESEKQGEILLDDQTIIEILKTDILQDEVYSTVRMFKTGVENGNGRIYPKAEGKEVIEELKSEIESGLTSEVFDGHSKPLYNEQGKIADYDRRENEKIADLVDVSFNDIEEDTELGEGIAKLKWNEKSDKGKIIADEIRANPDSIPDIKFSIRGKLGKCRTVKGKKVCPITKLHGLDAVDDPALDDAEIINNEVFQDSINNSEVNNKQNNILYLLLNDSASQCGDTCECDNCALNSTLGDCINMFDAERIKKLHMITPSLSWEQAKAIIVGDGWYYSTADCEMAEAYWLSMDKGEGESKPEVAAPAVTDMENKDKIDPKVVTDAETIPGEIKKDEDKEEVAKDAEVVEGPKVLKDGEVSQEALQTMMDQGISWDVAKQVLAALGDLDLVAAEALWMQMEEAAKTAVEDGKLYDSKGVKTVADNKTITQKPANAGSPARANNPNDNVLLDAKEASAFRAMLARDDAQQRQNTFSQNVEKSLAESKLNDSNKEYIRTVASTRYKANAASAKDLVDFAIQERQILQDSGSSDKALVDSRRAAMGYSAGNGTMQGSKVTVNHEQMPGAEVFAKLNDLTNEMLLDGTIKVQGIPNVREEVLRRKEQEKLLSKKFLPAMQDRFLKHGNNYEKLQDAITTSDIHGIGTVQNRETVLEWFTIMQTFFATTLTERIARALAPGSPQQSFPMTKASGARPIDLGGVFVMNLETVSESGAALAQNYRIPRNAGPIWPINTGLEYNLFATRSRMAGVTVDMENAAQLVTGALNYNIMVRAGINAPLALGRAVDTEIGEDLVTTTREVGAVSVPAETPVGTVNVTGEWFYLIGGSAAGYGTNVVGVQSLLTGRATTTLKTSADNGSYYPAPLVVPRTKTYVNGLTGATVDTTLFPVVVVIPTATAVLGYLDPVTLRIEALNDGEFPNYAFDPINARVCFTQGNGTSATGNTLSGVVRPSTAYWYSTNHVIWSKASGRWQLSTNTFISQFTSTTLLPARARGYVNEVSNIAGSIGQEKQVYPDFALGRFDFQNGYTAKAELFENRMLPMDAELLAGYGPSQVVCTDAGIVHMKTSNPRWSVAAKTITGMGKGASVILGKTDYSFYGLGYIYPDMGMHRATKSPSGGGINQAINAMMQEFGFLDTTGTPVYADGRNYPHYEIIVVD